MATSSQSQTNHAEPKPKIPNLDVDLEQKPIEGLKMEVVDYSSRAQWLRATVLGANDGLLSTASLMVGIGSVTKDLKTMLLTGIVGLVAGALSMAIGEFVSVYSQYDIEMTQIERDSRGREVLAEGEIEERKKRLPSPWKAAVASGASFSIGALVPLIAAAFLKDYLVRLAVVVAAVSLALLGFGGLSAVLGGTPLAKSSLRVLIGGLTAMGLTYGLTRLIGTTGIILG